jgi:RNA polymerase sigma-70 factor (ECF subfamily)
MAASSQPEDRLPEPKGEAAAGPSRQFQPDSVSASHAIERSDGELVELVLEGDRGAFEAIVARYQAPLRRVAFSRLGSLEAAAEVVQEAFLCAYKFLRSFDSRQSFRTWLWTIALNQCRRRTRLDKRLPRVSAWTDQQYDGERTAESFGMEPASVEQSPLARLLAIERRELLEQELQKLPEAQADALRLRFFGGLRFEEIAATMRCSLGTAKNRVKWGLLKIAQSMAVKPSPHGESRHGEHHEL